jgi:hypothetical protein
MPVRMPVHGGTPADHLAILNAIWTDLTIAARDLRDVADDG